MGSIPIVRSCASVVQRKNAALIRRRSLVQLQALVLWASNSVWDECFPCKEEVVGSTPTWSTRGEVEYRKLSSLISCACQFKSGPRSSCQGSACTISSAL